MELSTPFIVIALVCLGKKTASIYMAIKEKDWGKAKAESLFFF